MQNFDLLMASGFRKMEEVIIPAWLVNVDCRMAFDFEACEAADPLWLRAVLTERVRPGRFAFYLGLDREIDGELCQAILARLLLDDFVADRFRVRAIENSVLCFSEEMSHPLTPVRSSPRSSIVRLRIAGEIRKQLNSVP